MSFPDKYILLAFGISLILGWYIMPKIVLISKRKRLFDKLDERKEAKPPTPRLGGLAFFPVSLFALNLAIGISFISGANSGSEIPSSDLITLMFFSAGMVLLFLVGLTDDLVGVGYKSKLFTQIICASIVVYSGLVLDDFQNILFLHHIPPTIAKIITVLVIVFILNSFNLIDGVNGLCAGLSIVALVAIGGWYWYVGNFAYTMMAFSVLGVVAAFSFYNIFGTRTQLYMGDTGSLSLGFIVAFMALTFINDNHADYAAEKYEPINRVVLIIGLIFIPIFDTLRVFTTRLLQGKSPFIADRLHIHHKLLLLGLSHRKTTLILVLAQLGFFALNIILSQILTIDNNITILIDITIALTAIYLINKSEKKAKIAK